MGILSLITGKAGASGFGSGSTAEQLTAGVDATGLTVIVTDFWNFLDYREFIIQSGGASGIGLETSRVFAMRGAHVIIAARNTEAASVVRKKIIEENPKAHIDVLKLDLSSLKSVRAFADQFNSMNLPLNILINNAGVMFCPFGLSEDGVEMQFATNHLGHFLLTNLLLDNMKATAKSTGIESRIVNLSSVAHLHTYPKGIEFDKLNDEKTYDDKMAYGQSKLANILHAKELSRRLKIQSPRMAAAGGRRWPMPRRFAAKGSGDGDRRRSEDGNGDRRSREGGNSSRRRRVGGGSGWSAGLATACMARRARDPVMLEAGWEMVAGHGGSAGGGVGAGGGAEWWRAVELGGDGGGGAQAAVGSQRRATAGRLASPGQDPIPSTGFGARASCFGGHSSAASFWTAGALWRRGQQHGAESGMAPA
ncbi:hypothetical protein OsI_00419 [Oryza sativa Indica Group]|uniref:Uncharacterized protein n=1 Tax=Oryza sativa subsp. indica TaxID=39946 RepID=B8ADB3_ORYSI|nr:hypothetical protein OsI_00419 [Oryza sativa Indica Group]